MRDENYITLFMAVPTIYYYLIAYFEDGKILSELNKEYSPEEIKEKLQRIRLMVSGSAALPEKVMKKWEQISGHTLLERYGTTECGMILSNLYEGGPRIRVKNYFL